MARGPVATEVRGTIAPLRQQLLEGQRVRSGAAVKPGAIRGQVRKLTQRRANASALREAEDRYRELFENTVTGIAHVHADGRFIAVNRAWARVLGYGSPDQYVAEVGNARNIYEDPGQRDLFLAELTERGTVANFEARLRHRDGSTVWVAMEARAVTDASGRLAEIHASGLDVTARKRAEQTLRESEARFRSIFNNSIDGIIVAIGDAIVSANPAACAMLGRDEDELRRLGRSSVVDAADPRVGEALSPRPGGPSRAEVRMWRADGSGFPADVTCSAFVDADGKTRTAMIVRDASERRQAENLLRRAKHEADAANRAKDEFLSRVSHELRTPLNAVLGFAQLLETEVAEEQQESVQQIRRAGRHLLNLINEVLDIAQIEAGRLTVSKEPILLSELVDDVVRLMRPVGAGVGVELRVDLAQGDLYLHADRQRARQVMLNLLSNGIKYNRPGGTVTVRCRGAEGDMIPIAVEDTGIGIAASDIERLFTPFERLSAANSAVEGTGVGLALTRRLTEVMGGRILVHSSPGVGSTFVVELPSVEGTASDATPTTILRRPQLLPHPGMSRQASLLYIEDNPANARLLEAIVGRRPGWRLLHAGQAHLGIELAASNRPDLILLDLHLPDMPGAEVLQRLKAAPALAEVPVVVVTADASPGQAERLLAMGAANYLTKPIDVVSVLEVLDSTAARLVAGQGDVPPG